MDILPKIQSLIKALPQAPGVYKYLDKNKKIIYVGKAKNLKKRVSSYFVKKQQSFKTQLLVNRIDDIEFTVVDNESEALLLENSLIKALQPRYNVLLKDDKTYPWICIKNEAFPRVFITRKKIPDGSEYYGPFTSVYLIRTLLNLIKKLYPIRTCNLNLSPENIKNKKYKVCLEYHIGNCLGPCIGELTEDENNVFISNIRNILNGDLQTIQKYLTDQMFEYSSELRFEEAAKIKDKLELLENYRSKSTVVDTKISNIEVYGFAKDINSIYVNFLRIRNGSIIATHSVELKKRIEESDADMLLYAILEIRKSLNSNEKHILSPIDLGYELKDIKVELPKRGDKLKVLKLAQQNAKFFMLERHKQVENKNPESNINRKLETLRKDLHLKELPRHIECFDNSNIQGTNPVAACVVFRNTKPSKSEYRHYNIKTVIGANDFASMKEIVFRRYKRLLDEDADLPQLIIIDGGKGQLSSAVESLKELNIYGKIAIIGIAKKLEEIYFPNDSLPLYLDKNSESLKIIQQARDEAHRFGITFHRNKRSAGFIKSELESIKGIGQNTRLKLISDFKTVNKIKTLDLEQISASIGMARAKMIFNYFHPEEMDKEKS